MAKSCAGDLWPPNKRFERKISKKSPKLDATILSGKTAIFFFETTLREHPIKLKLIKRNQPEIIPNGTPLMVSNWIYPNAWKIHRQFWNPANRLSRSRQPKFEYCATIFSVSGWKSWFSCLCDQKEEWQITKLPSPIKCIETKKRSDWFSLFSWEAKWN